MFVAFGFKIKPVKNGQFYNHPPLGAGDIDRLNQLFPDNPIWKSEKSTLGNAYLPTREEALAFYRALKAYAERSEISSKEYTTGNFMGSLPVSSNLKSVFDELIQFFEDELELNPATSQ